ncbi:hypothetical protein H5154_21760 [Pseudoalteromonas sp. SR44-5]|uniref:hypothetical protein n=1 Tax=unclassified Pseudoalteromonas TaxID=194690 RepID=UPI00160009E9|nr:MULTISPECIES: hypothetical protein [unclassified Pseudoalteromonas]MBB1368969.1 hypothetical protein [Pseudoalteromonas sp. SR44-5]MBB1470780.1 hypothetical protein [Pseudoalteromonas sp. SG41-5]
MNKTKFELIDIAKAGASLVIDGKKFTKFEIIDIAKVILDGCTIEVQNCHSKTKYELIDIAKVAKAGKIIFS